MHDSTLDLFCNNETVDDRQQMIDTMRDTYWNAMHNCVNLGREIDAVSVYEEWVVDGVDPQDGESVFTFVLDLTRLIEDQ
tara:strand:- start:51 stop:290 length:240 start_codon:yes stop_codon:yes gene_type:complete